ncbi:flavin reductase family protein [Streptomyces sp. S3(2020)]|nr:flavin reductase family protein [Streptomyces sp. S3(2020)]NNN29426.1 flavin reductase family protein [Streptomyces sp. S3(2020)]
MARVPAPVTVTTTVDGTGRQWGFTASAFTSLSLEPPLILVCVDRAASVHCAFASAEHFLVNVLAKHQADVAARFAARGADRFTAGDTEPCELGLPGLPDAALRVACRVHEVLDGGDHSILVGHVEATYTSARTPLLYCDRTFDYPARLDRVEHG